ncbi:MAG TPA: type I-U CRISPR-associated protein Csb2 [Phycisphaerae bacterium]|nr:type I-U CRISPR-associated protein Csb2 [Phycisphaerae bacterium]
MAYLLLTIRFLDTRYHGQGDGGRREWPPSPMRLFSALVAGAKPHWCARWKQAFQWLEQQQPPTIYVPDKQDGAELLTYVPNNNSDTIRDPAKLRAAKPIRPTLIGQPPVVRYCWQVGLDDREQAEAMIQVARHIRALGWGIDMAVGHGGWHDAVPTDPRLRCWRVLPRDIGGGVSLRVPAPGSLKSLEAAYALSLKRIDPNGIIYDQPAAPVFEMRAYASSLARPFCALALQTPDGEVAAFRPRQIKALVAMIRHAGASGAVRRAVDHLNGSRPPNAPINVDQAILGHPPDAPGPRLSVLPLPSVGHRHSDGLIRRVILAEPFGGDGALCRLLWQALPDMVLRPASGDEDLPGETFMTQLSPNDRFLRYYAPTHRSARVWASVTPVLLPGYDDRRQHRGNHLKRLARSEQLLCKALSQAGLDIPARMEMTRVPWWPGSLHARDYTVREKLQHYPRYHVRLSFDEPISGPLAVGAGRHTGFGVFAACEDQGDR